MKADRTILETLLSSTLKKKKRNEKWSPQKGKELLHVPLAPACTGTLQEPQLLQPNYCI